MTRLAVVILAGGELRRIGGAKPLRTLGGRTLLDRALEQARGWSDDVAVSVRAPGQLGDPGVPELIDDPALDGPIAGLAAGLRHARETLLTIPCDTPFLPEDLTSRLAAALGENEKAALASSDGRLHGTCALWRAEALEALPAYLETGRRSLIGLAEAVGFTAVAWPAEPVDPFFNVNDEADLARAEALLRGQGLSSRI